MCVRIVAIHGCCTETHVEVMYVWSDGDGPSWLLGGKCSSAANEKENIRNMTALSCL